MGNSVNALNNINKSIETNQNNFVAFELRGVINSRLENLQNAIDDYNKVRTLDIKYFNNSANILLNLPSLDENMPFEEKIKLTERAIQLAPNYEIAFYNLGYYYKEVNNLDKAIEAFKKAHELAPSNIDSIRELCNCLTQQMDLINLKIYLEKAVALGDENAIESLENLNSFFN